MASADCYRAAARIVAGILGQQDGRRVAVVVSAMGGKPKVTDLLLQAVRHASTDGVDSAMELLAMVRKKYCECIADLLVNQETAAGLISEIDGDLRDLRDVLRAVELMKFDGEQMLELVSGYGEVWSAKVFNEHLCELGHEFSFINAKEVLFVENGGASGLEVLYEKSREALTKKIEGLPGNNKTNLMITGYVASTSKGLATTLRRDGSDFSASIFGQLLSAADVSIWTDVNGVLTADPRRVPGAQSLARISYYEATELAYWGAKVIHPKTMQPAIIEGIPIYIRNTFEPDMPGTKIHVSDAETQSRSTCVCVRVSQPGWCSLPISTSNSLH